MTVSPIEAEKWHTGQLHVNLEPFLNSSFSNLCIDFCIVYTWEYFLLSFVSELTSCPDQCSLFQCFLVPRPQFRFEYSSDGMNALLLRHAQNSASLRTPHSPSHSPCPRPSQEFILIPRVLSRLFWIR